SWIGPAPMRPYKTGAYHSFNWRGWVDFGTGALGDMACHTCNLPVMALNLWDPVAVTAVKNPGIVEGETFPGATTLMFEFPERDGLKACRFYWYDGGNLPADELVAKLPAGFRKQVEEQKQGKGRTSACLIVGSKGMLLSQNDYGAAYTLLPEENFRDFKKPEPTLPRIPFKGGGDERQKWEFVESVRGNYKPGTMSNFGYAGRLTETILVGNLAVRAGEGQRIEWDAKKLISTSHPDLNKFVHREYRSGYSL
ncbi:MAG: Inositol 2-dehydrogenase, partial [Planctomycetota bacterium]